MSLSARPVTSAIALGLAASLLVAGASAASAASASGSMNCGILTPQLTLHSSAFGDGSWQSRTTAAVTSFAFPAGHPKRLSPYSYVNWVAVQDGANSYWFSPAQSTCITS